METKKYDVVIATNGIKIIEKFRKHNLNYSKVERGDSGAYTTR
jgi:hypothetical protein